MKTIVFRTIGGGFIAIDEQNISAISTMYITDEFIPAYESGKVIPEQPERGYIKHFESKFLSTYERNGLGAIKTQWTYKVNKETQYKTAVTDNADSAKTNLCETVVYQTGVTVPMKPVLRERRGIIHYDIHKKFFVFADITEALEQYLAEREAEAEAERVLSMLPKTEAEQIADDDDETAYPVDYASEEEYENAEDAPKYQDEVLLEDIEEADGSTYEVSDTGKLSQIIASSPNIMILRPA